MFCVKGVVLWKTKQKLDELDFFFKEIGEIVSHCKNNDCVKNHCPQCSLYFVMSADLFVIVGK